jgi:hypothetical protein
MARTGAQRCRRAQRRYCAQRLLASLVAGTLLAATPSLAQTVATCTRSGVNQPPPVPVLFDLGSTELRDADKSKIGQAVAAAEACHATSICLVEHTDKFGGRALNEKIARARSQAVAAELVHAGYSAKDIVIVADPETFCTKGTRRNQSAHKFKRRRARDRGNCFSRRGNSQRAIRPWWN